LILFSNEHSAMSKLSSCSWWWWRWRWC